MRERKAGGMGMEDERRRRDKGQCWPSRAKPAARRRTRRQRGDALGSHCPSFGNEQRRGRASLL